MSRAEEIAKELYAERGDPRLKRIGTLLTRGATLGMAEREKKPTSGLLENVIELAGGVPTYMGATALLGPVAAPLAKYGTYLPKMAIGSGLGAIAEAAPKLAAGEPSEAVKSALKGAGFGLATETAGVGLSKLAQRIFRGPLAKRATDKAVTEGVLDASVKGSEFRNARAKELMEARKAARAQKLEGDASVIPGIAKPPKPPMTPSNPPPIGHGITPGTKQKKQPPPPGWFVSMGNSIRQMFSPASASDVAKETALGLRKFTAEYHLKNLRAEHALTKFMKSMDKMDQGTTRLFIDNFEHNRPQGTPELTQIDKALRDILKSREKELGRLGLLRTFYENYFPHIWERTSHAAEFFARHPLAGKQSYRKNRKYYTFAEGLKNNLVPLTENPAKLVLLKLREIDKSVMAHRFKEYLKDNGLSIYVPNGKKPPAGWMKAEDPMFRVMGKIQVNAREAYDKEVFDGLTRVANALGIRGKRTAEVRRGFGRNVWGLYSRNTRQMVTRFGGPESVIAHEIGHHLGYENPEIRALAMQPEITNLANLRWHGLNASNAFRQYVQGANERQAVMLEAYIHAPQLFQRTAPQAYQKFHDILRSNPRYRELTRIKPSLVLGSAETQLQVPGLHEKGNWYLPSHAVGIIDRYLKPGLYSGGMFDRGKENKIYGLARAFGNNLNQAQLGLSLFHLMFEIIDTAASQADVGIRRMFHGATHGSLSQVGKGLKEFSTSFIPFNSAFSTVMKGNKMMKEILEEGSQGNVIGHLVQQFIDAGGRAKWDQFYHGNAYDNFLKALKSPGLVKKLPAAYQWFPAFFEWTAKPVMEQIVPRMKLGAFMRMAEFELERSAQLGMNSMQVHALMARAWDSVDNRLGQLVYDNLFWNRTTKDMLMLMVRSLGWNIGTVREFGGAVPDAAKFTATLLKGKMPELTPRMAYTVGLSMQVAFAGAILSYMMTGKAPEQGKNLAETAKNYYFPKTGNKLPDGTDERISLPSYIKDYAAISAEGIGKVVKGKVHPMLPMVSELFDNKDYYGALIREPEDPYWKQLEQVGSYVVDQYIPIGMRQFKQTKGAWVDPKMAPLSFIGITPAPKYITQTPGTGKAGQLEHIARIRRLKQQITNPRLTDQVIRFLYENESK